MYQHQPRAHSPRAPSLAWYSECLSLPSSYRRWTQARTGGWCLRRHSAYEPTQCCAPWRCARTESCRNSSLPLPRLPARLWRVEAQSWRCACRAGSTPTLHVLVRPNLDAELGVICGKCRVKVLANAPRPHVGDCHLSHNEAVRGWWSKHLEHYLGQCLLHR